MPTPQDPFTQVYQRILAVLQTDPVVSVLVRSANWITFDKKAPWKRNAQEGDMPEILIEPVTGLDAFASDSMAAKLDMVWSIKVATMDSRLYWLDANNNMTGVFAMHWALINALYNAGDALASPNSVPVLPALSFLRVARITASVKSPFDPAGNPVSEARGTDGWTILCTLACTLDIPQVAGVLQLPNG